jgi:hypothetical protein
MITVVRMPATSAPANITQVFRLFASRNATAIPGKMLWLIASPDERHPPQDQVVPD